MEISDVSANRIGKIDPAVRSLFSMPWAYIIHKSRAVLQKKPFNTDDIEKIYGENHTSHLVSDLAIQVNIRTANKRSGKWILVKDHS